MTARSNRWVWRWYWVPYEPEWLLIPTLSFSYWPRGPANSVAQWALTVKWLKYAAGFGAHVYPRD